MVRARPNTCVPCCCAVLLELLSALALCRSQSMVRMQPMSRGCHVVTREVLRQVPEIQEYEIGMANFFILHTSASLTISENASPDVPLDMAVRFPLFVTASAPTLAVWWAAFAQTLQHPLSNTEILVSELCGCLQDALDRIVPEGKFYRHLDEGMVSGRYIGQPLFTIGLLLTLGTGVALRSCCWLAIKAETRCSCICCWLAAGCHLCMGYHWI